MVVNEALNYVRRIMTFNHWSPARQIIFLYERSKGFNAGVRKIKYRFLLTVLFRMRRCTVLVF